MAPRVRLRDGIEIELDAGERVVADASSPDGDVNVLSHAHGDHRYADPPETVVCSETTAALAGSRREGTADREPEPAVVDHPRITLLDAGHVAGSRAALLEDEDATVLYTGDVSTRDRFFLDGFEPVSADVLVVEATYGTPAYALPPQAEVEAAFVEWLRETMDRPVVAFGYTLGRAQELLLLGERAGREAVYVTDAIARTNAVIEAELGVSLDATRYGDHELGAGDFLLLPSQTNRLSFVDDIVERTGAVTVAASGWAVDESYRYRTGVDRTFALSDHCGFDELLALVEQVDPGQVYTTHGFADELATAITGRLGYPAQSLQRNQTTLDDF